jgi:hypothetical protein
MRQASSPPQDKSKPLAPLWIFKLVNPIVNELLRSPLHGLMSKMLMCLPNLSVAYLLLIHLKHKRTEHGLVRK